MRMKKLKKISAMLLVLAVSASCEIVDNDIDKSSEDSNDGTKVELKSVATLLADIPLQDSHIAEVYAAVTSSSENGYDEEYLMKNLFENPGAGVGGTATRGANYESLLKDIIVQHLTAETLTKAGSDVMDPETFVEILTSSDIQIYWPYSESWDGKSLPVITFDPENGEDSNVGYELITDDQGSRSVRTVVVDEDMAKSRPVWIVNRNSDAGYTPVCGLADLVLSPSAPATKADITGRSLVLKEIKANRNFDNFFAGASELWIKTGAVEDFTAVTEAEMYLYNPSVTDFMLVMKRGQVGKSLPMNVLLVSNWTDQMVNSAFMITEDDGGTRTDWECTALVRVESKSYGIEMKLPFNSKDDIVWRGQLASKWLEANNCRPGHFGDVDITFEVLEY